MSLPKSDQAGSPANASNTAHSASSLPDASVVNYDRDRWSTLAAWNPYWTVLCDEDRYRPANLPDSEVEEFFRSGAREVARTFESIRRHVLPDFHPRVSVDYGCGVGRLTLPIARESAKAIGVDISPAMLASARRNSVERGVTNAEFIDAEAFLSGRAGADRVDFVHSFIVLQHIRPRIGMRISDMLLRRLAPGGVAALHYTYARQASAARQMIHALRRNVRIANVAANIVQGRPLLEHMIPMYQYDLGELNELFRSHGCESLHVVLTQHGQHSGAMFMFRKPE
jgi:SAM-dependent methyltransferase